MPHGQLYASEEQDHDLFFVFFVCALISECGLRTPPAGQNLR